MPIYFISGHLDLTLQEFWDHYEPRIRKLHNDILETGVVPSFVVGDAHGADLMAQRLLVLLPGFRDRVTVYHMHGKPRHHVLCLPTVGGFKSDDERDAAMTAASDEDIAWVRPGRENSGTAKNLKRRLEFLQAEKARLEKELAEAKQSEDPLWAPYASDGVAPEQLEWVKEQLRKGNMGQD